MFKKTQGISHWMELFPGDNGGPNVPVGKLLLPCYPSRFIPEHAKGYFWMGFYGGGGDLIWGSCCLLGALELRCALGCPVRRPRIELHSDQQGGPGECIIQLLVHCPASPGTISSGIRWIIEFRRSSFCIGLASPRST